MVSRPTVSSHDLGVRNASQERQKHKKEMDASHLPLSNIHRGSISMTTMKSVYTLALSGATAFMAVRNG